MPVDNGSLLRQMCALDSELPALAVHLLRSRASRLLAIATDQAMPSLRSSADNDVSICTDFAFHTSAPPSQQPKTMCSPSLDTAREFVQQDTQKVAFTPGAATILFVSGVLHVMLAPCAKTRLKFQNV